jgi:hypothetical protein
MARITINQLSETSALSSDSVFPVFHDGRTKKVTLENVLQYALASDNQTLSFNSETKDLSISNGNTIGLGHTHNTSDITGLSLSSFVVKSGDTMTGKLNLPASTTTNASFNIQSGDAPTNPVAGDIWLTSNILNYRSVSQGNKPIASTANVNTFTSLQVISAAAVAGSTLSVTNASSSTTTSNRAADFTVSNGTGPVVLITQNGNGRGLHIVNRTGSGDSLYIEDESPESSPFVVNADGRVGIGTANPNEVLTVIGNISAIGTHVLETNSTNPALRINQTGTGPVLVVEDSEHPDESPLTIDNDGRIITGGSQTLSLFHKFDDNSPNLTSIMPGFQNQGLGPSSGNAIFRLSDNSIPALLFLNKARGTTALNLSSVLVGDRLGKLSFGGHDGQSFYEGAIIEGIVSDNPSIGSIPTDIRFNTSNTGAFGISERMRITANGNTGIGTTTPNERLTVNGNISASGNISANNHNATNWDQVYSVVQTNSSTNWENSKLLGEFKLIGSGLVSDGIYKVFGDGVNRNLGSGSTGYSLTFAGNSIIKNLASSENENNYIFNIDLNIECIYGGVPILAGFIITYRNNGQMFSIVSAGTPTRFNDLGNNNEVHRIYFENLQTLPKTLDYFRLEITAQRSGGGETGITGATLAFRK